MGSILVFIKKEVYSRIQDGFWLCFTKREAGLASRRLGHG